MLVLKSPFSGLFVFLEVVCLDAQRMPIAGEQIFIYRTFVHGGGQNWLDPFLRTFYDFLSFHSTHYFADDGRAAFCCGACRKRAASV
ncbi:MAG: hypothetical protein NTY70_03055 [Burkholderiales bacterium]|nr:hypothetical protein [Burkholderiales bacterium]